MARKNGEKTVYVTLNKYQEKNLNAFSEEYDTPVTRIIGRAIDEFIERKTSSQPGIRTVNQIITEAIANALKETPTPTEEVTKSSMDIPLPIIENPPVEAIPTEPPLPDSLPTLDEPVIQSEQQTQQDQ